MIQSINRMKKKILPYLIYLLLLIQGCETESIKDYSIPEYDGSLKWERINRKAEWSNRFDHAAAVFNNKIWIFGGYNPGQIKADTYYEDVWNSADGKKWKLIKDKAAWKGRRSFTVTVYNDGAGDAMFLIGGFSVDEETGYRQYNNDVWKSTDGINWEEIKKRSYPDRNSTSDWFPRMNHSCIKVNHRGNDYIYLIGGSSMIENHPSGPYSMIYFNDVWRTTNGIDWEKLPNNDYGIRSGHATTVDQATGRIYLQGGMFGVIFSTENNAVRPLPDWHHLWYTDDGINWISEKVSSDFDEELLHRAEHQMFYYQNKLWGLPGKTNSNQHFRFAEEIYYTSWVREENKLWSVDSYGTDIDARYAYALVEFENKIWILGGDTNSFGPSNDVWCATLK